MDPRNRADETLAHARARGAFVVTPDNATSPMDASTTVRIPRGAMPGGGSEPNPTIQFPDQGPHSAGTRTSTSEDPTTWPTEDRQQPTQPQEQPQQQAQAQQQPAGQRSEADQSNVHETPEWPTTEQSDQWQHPTSPFGPLNPETAQRLQW